MRLFLLAILLTLSLPVPVSSQTATYYGPGFAGKRMANGKPYNPNHYVAAHPRYPLGTRLRVTHRRTGHSVVVTVADRCACSLDLSSAAFRRIGRKEHGRIPVRITRL